VHDNDNANASALQCENRKINIGYRVSTNFPAFHSIAHTCSQPASSQQLKCLLTARVSLLKILSNKKLFKLNTKEALRCKNNTRASANNNKFSLIFQMNLACFRTMSYMLLFVARTRRHTLHSELSLGSLTGIAAHCGGEHKLSNVALGIVPAKMFKHIHFRSLIDMLMKSNWHELCSACSPPGRHSGSGAGERHILS